MASVVLHFLIVFITSVIGNQELSPWQSAVEIVDIQNDAVTINWNLPEDISNLTTWQRVMISVIRSNLPVARSSISGNVSSTERTFEFTGLMGNTTYRAAVEAFRVDESLWYASNMVTTNLASLKWLTAPTDFTLLDKTNETLEIWWTAPVIQQTAHSAVITQHLLNVYEFKLEAKQMTKKLSINIPVPKSSFTITRLSPSSVYNLTLQAGTSYGYGNMVWAIYSTLDNTSEGFVLKHKTKTPNSITVTWPNKWLPTATSKFTIRAKTLYSPDNVLKEITMEDSAVPGKPSEFVLKNLNPGSTYNISIYTTIPNEKNRDKKLTPVVRRGKMAWSVFSTLTQGEYAVGEPRIVVESETAVSIVFQPLKDLGPIAYQIRYIANDDSKGIETHAYSESELICPKFGCEWLCALVFNLPRRPRDYNFEIRAKVDDIWNKWVPIVRRPWNLLERVCSINPPSSMVGNLGNIEHQREIDVESGNLQPVVNDVWRYLVVVDNRQSDYSVLDIARLADRATADIDRIPYYVTASLSVKDVENNVPFRIGDGQVRGGYLNYPLRDDVHDPRWTLVPMSETENEILEPRLKTCGFTEDGHFDCDMSMMDLVSHMPWWLSTLLFILFIVLLFAALLTIIYLCRRSCEKHEGLKESSIMYYHNDSPNTTSTTREYKRVERREFRPADLEERMRFMSDDT